MTEWTGLGHYSGEPKDQTPKWVGRVEISLCALAMILILESWGKTKRIPWFTNAVVYTTLAWSPTMDAWFNRKTKSKLELYVTFGLAAFAIIIAIYFSLKP